MITLKTACLRQDNITNVSIKKEEASRTTLNASSNGEHKKNKGGKGKRKKKGDTSKVKCHVCMKLGHCS